MGEELRSVERLRSMLLLSAFSSKAYSGTLVACTLAIMRMRFNKNSSLACTGISVAG